MKWKDFLTQYAQLFISNHLTEEQCLRYVRLSYRRLTNQMTKMNKVLSNTSPVEAQWQTVKMACYETIGTSKAKSAMKEANEIVNCTRIKLFKYRQQFLKEGITSLKEGRENKAQEYFIKRFRFIDVY